MISLKEGIVVCDRCKKEIVDDDYEQYWSISQYAGYGSQFDGEWISKQICDECLGEFLGECN